jgi:Phosphorylase superfamily
MLENLKILVPQGAEYKAVCRGLSRISNPTSKVIAIPVGSKALIQYLPQWINTEEIRNQKPSQILVMGLCGSLNPSYDVGKIVLYSECIYRDKTNTNIIEKCDPNFIAKLNSHLQQKTSLVKALTTDTVICKSKEKQHLFQTSAADVVDMEGFTILSFFNQTDIPVAMLRVVSDGCYHNIPDLSKSISPTGKIQPLPLAIAMLRQPIAATRLINGSLKALKTLEQATKLIFA